MSLSLDNAPSPAAAGESGPGFRGLVVVIPTRNRSDLAIRAIRSALVASPASMVQVMVSDNSTEESETATLEKFCRSLNDDRLRYIKPPEPMKMSEHWEWAFGQALDRYDARHFTLLADRRVYTRNALDELCGLAKQHPDTVIVSLWEVILDHIQPVKVGMRNWSGRLKELKSDELLRANARAGWELEQVPTPFVSIIPRRVFGEVRERFGNLCLSIAPDYCFGYRVLDLEDSILFYDKPTSMMLGANRSTGFSFSRGIVTKDKADFVASNGGEEFSYWATPCPQVITGYNGVFHEYNFVKTQSRTNRFAELDLPAYLNFLRTEIRSQFEDPNLKARYLEILDSMGTPEQEAPPAHMSLKHRGRQFIKNLVKKPLSIKPLMPLYLSFFEAIGVQPPRMLNSFGFSSTDQAIRFLQGRNLVPPIKSA